MLLTTIFYHVDNFCNEIKKQAVLDGETNKSVNISLYIFFQHSKIKTFKDYYAIYIKGLHKDAFTHEARWELIEENIAYLALFA